MNKIDQIKQALHDADELDMIYECVETLRDTLPALLEAVEALASITDNYAPEGCEDCGVVEEHEYQRGLLALAKLKGE